MNNELMPVVISIYKGMYQYEGRPLIKAAYSVLSENSYNNEIFTNLLRSINNIRKIYARAANVSIEDATTKVTRLLLEFKSAEILAHGGQMHRFEPEVQKYITNTLQKGEEFSRQIQQAAQSISTSPNGFYDPFEAINQPSQTGGFNDVDLFGRSTQHNDPFADMSGGNSDPFSTTQSINFDDFDSEVNVSSSSSDVNPLTDVIHVSGFMNEVKPKKVEGVAELKFFDNKELISVEAMMYDPSNYPEHFPLSTNNDLSDREQRMKSKLNYVLNAATTESPKDYEADKDEEIKTFVTCEAPVEFKVPFSLNALDSVYRCKLQETRSRVCTKQNVLEVYSDVIKPLAVFKDEADLAEFVVNNESVSKLIKGVDTFEELAKLLRNMREELDPSNVSIYNYINTKMTDMMNSLKIDLVANTVKCVVVNFSEDLKDFLELMQKTTAKNNVRKETFWKVIKELEESVVNVNTQLITASDLTKDERKQLEELGNPLLNNSIFIREKTATLHVNADINLLQLYVNSRNEFAVKRNESPETFKFIAMFLERSSQSVANLCKHVISFGIGNVYEIDMKNIYSKGNEYFYLTKIG